MFFQTLPIIFSPAQSIFCPLEKFKKEHIWQKSSACGNSKRASKNSLLHIKDIKKIWRSIAFSLCCIFCFFVLLQSVKLHFQQLQLASNKDFQKVLDCWSLVWTFCPSITNLFCLQLKLFRIKLNCSESPQKNDICLIFIILTFHLIRTIKRIVK